MSKRPNILIITADEYRSDCLGFAGHPDVTTPYLDSLAQKGIYFPNAYSSCPTCVPARAVFHTGLKPANTGRVGYRDGVDWNYSRTLGSEFTRLGYQTQVCG
ncbi:MAG: sulfatase-like hydrolase/transferase [Clostridiales bacterium]|nr:sulfatase-like hydrolase/transferase [Clostridiales bacterium]